MLYKDARDLLVALLAEKQSQLVSVKTILDKLDSDIKQLQDCITYLENTQV